MQVNRRGRVLSCLLLVLAGGAAAARLVAEDGISFSEESLSAHIRQLSDRSFLGRGAGTPFERRAAEYVARQLESMDISPLPSGERMQPFKLDQRDGDATSTNVLGSIGPKDMKQGLVVLGAHLDHLGATDDGGYFPGADDNASGVAVVLEVGRMLRRNASSLKRPVVLAFFGAEEIGLIGSREFMSSGCVETAQILAMVNVDMIGRPLADQARLAGVKRLFRIDADKGIGVVGTQGRPQFTKIVEDACQDAGLTPYGTQAVLSPIVATLARNRSDHAPFEQVGVPTIFFGSGESDDYHQPTDTFEKVRVDLVALRARVVYQTVLTLATTPRDQLPPRENAVAPDGEIVDTLELQVGKLKAQLRGNRESPRVLSGLQSLYHEAAPDFDAFDPDAQGSSAGLNFEHIISGHAKRPNSFTPRRRQYEMYRHADKRSATLVRFREHSPWDVSSTLTYTLREPHYVDFEFECTPHTASLFGNRGHAIFFFANYMNDVIDPAIHFRGVGSPTGEETWIAASAPAEHADWNGGGTYRHRDAKPIEYDEHHEFKLNSWSYDVPRYTQPFYYGRAAHGMLMMLMFDRAHTARDEVRFSLFKFKLPQRQRPAWDFQYVIHRVAQNEKYGFRGRLVWKPWVSQEDCLEEYRAWHRSLDADDESL